MILSCDSVKSALTQQALKALSSSKIPSEYGPYPCVTHGMGDGLLKYVSTFDCLCDLPEPEDAKDASQKKNSKAKYRVNIVKDRARSISIVSAQQFVLSIMVILSIDA